MSERNVSTAVTADIATSVIGSAALDGTNRMQLCRCNNRRSSAARKELIGSEHDVLVSQERYLALLVTRRSIRGYYRDVPLLLQFSELYDVHADSRARRIERVNTGDVRKVRQANCKLPRVAYPLRDRIRGKMRIQR